MDVLDREGASDALLTVAASRGDDEAFAVLYVRYAPRIGAYLHRLLSDEHLAQDLTHEVFVSALNRLRSARAPVAFGPWLYRIARNASIDVHRRSQLVRQVPLPAPEDERAAMTGRNEPQAEAERRQWLDDLRDLLGGLSDNHRSVLVLRELEGLSNSEIAERMGVSRPAVEGLLFRARAKVRSEYADLESGRRCLRVQTALDRTAGGERLGRRERQLASRHLNGCAQCRRHAWEAGVTDLLQRATRRRSPRALVPAPVLGWLSRYSPDDAPLLASPWGRTVAAVSAVAVAGGAVAPHVREQQASAPPATVAAIVTSGPTALASPAAAPVRSPAATTTVLPRPAAAVPPPAPPPAVAPAPAAAAPVPTPAPAASPPWHDAPAPAPAVGSTPARPAPTATAARTRETAERTTAPVIEAAPQPLATPVAQAVATLGDTVEQVASAAEDVEPQVAPLVSDAVAELVAPAVPQPEPPATPAIPEVPAAG